VAAAEKATLAAGTNPALQAAAEKAKADYMAALENDLNTAEARAPIFDLVRTVNSALDAGSAGRGPGAGSGGAGQVRRGVCGDCGP
jgi:cysteinyl-tRNA synthetase